jgi:thioredoxin-related protein
VKRIALFVVALLFAVTSQASANPWIKSLADAQKRAKEKNQLIFVDLFADWCGWCHKMEQEVFPSMAFQTATDDMVLLRLNTEDGKEGTILARTYGATSLPTFLVLTYDEQLAGVIHGYQPSSEFVRLLKDERTHFADFAKRVANESAVTVPAQRLALAKEMRERHALAQSEERFRKLLSDSKVPPGVRDDAYYELALTQLLEKKYDDSMVTLNKFAKVQSKGITFERSRLLIGDVYISKGDFKSAADTLRAFKKNYPGSTLIEQVDYVLPQIERAIPTTAGKK